MPTYVYIKPTDEFGVVTNSTDKDAAVRVSGSGHSWWRWDELVMITWAECVNRVRPKT